MCLQFRTLVVNRRSTVGIKFNLNLKLFDTVDAKITRKTFRRKSKRITFLDSVNFSTCVCMQILNFVMIT